MTPCIHHAHPTHAHACTHLGDDAVDEDDGDLLALLLDDAVVLAAPLRLGLLEGGLDLLPQLDVVHAARQPRVLVGLERREALAQVGRPLGVLLDVVGVRVLVDHEVVDLVDDDDRPAEDLVELPLEHLAHEEVVDARLEAVDHLRLRVEQVDAAADAEGLEEGPVRGEVALE